MVPFRLQETLTIEKLVYGGEGLARLEGKVVLTPFVLPGEMVRGFTADACAGARDECGFHAGDRITPFGFRTGGRLGG